MDYMEKYSDKSIKLNAAIELSHSSNVGNEDFYSETSPNRANEIRANWGQAGVMLACPDFASGRNGITTDVKDALGNIAHFCDRAGIDPQEIFSAALDAYNGDFEDGPKASHDESFVGEA